MERILGLRGAETAKGAGVLWLGRQPDREEFALRAYKQCPGGATYDGQGLHLASPKWEVLRSLPIGMGTPRARLQGKSKITLELKGRPDVIIHGLTYWPLPLPDFDNVRPRSWSPV